MIGWELSNLFAHPFSKRTISGNGHTRITWPGMLIVMSLVAGLASGDCIDFGARKKRIDYLFSEALVAAKQATFPPASHDLTCGMNPNHLKERQHNCDWLRNPQRYSDHRLVWTLIGDAVATPVAPSPSP